MALHLILWSTQSFSALGSSMTSFALIIWSYQQQGSALTTAILALLGIQAVIIFDLATFGAAFFSLMFLVIIPKVYDENTEKETVLQSAKAGLRYLKDNRGLLDLILFLAAINLTASVYNAALPAMLLSRDGGGNVALGVVNTVTGVTLLAGSMLASVLPTPKSRVRIICNTRLISMSTKNFFLAFGHSVPIWCTGAALGWICIPIMNVNMDVLFRNHIPIQMQGRAFSARNTLQFFTIPIGYFLGGIMVDKIFEPFMASQVTDSFLSMVFGTGKGSGAALLFFVIAIVGVTTCLVFRRDPYIWKLEK